MVRHDLAGGEQLGGARVQTEIGDVPVLGVGRQAEQPAGLVVGQDEPLVGVDDDHALADGVQDGLVVLVDPAHLGRAQAPGLAPQPAADQGGATGTEQQGARGRTEQERELALDDLGDVLHLYAGADQADDDAVGVPYRDDGPHGVARLAPEGLREGVPGEGAAEVTGGPSADQLGP